MDREIYTLDQVVYWRLYGVVVDKIGLITKINLVKKDLREIGI